jgi:hypothetical protein
LVKKRTLLAIVCFLCAHAAWTQTVSGQVRLGLSGTLDWEKAELTAAASLNLASAGVKLPTGRLQGEELLSDEYPRLLRPYLLTLQADSSRTVEDLVHEGELSLSTLDSLIFDADKTAPSLSPDLALLTGRYRLSLHKLSSALSKHSRATEAPRSLMPVATANYTGIIIIADQPLPIHGRKTQALLQPCIFPKIWDSDMNLVYEKNMTDPQQGAVIVRYTTAGSIFGPTPSGLAKELAELAGDRPLRIIAQGAFGVKPTDPVIDREDALKIISSENNRRLLKEGRVVLVVSGDTLRTSF